MFKLSYLLFVFFAVFVVLENVLEVENVVFASLVFPFYTISFMLFGLSCYRTYNFYVGTLETSQGRAFAEIAKVFFAVMSLVIILSVVLTQFGLKISYSMFIAGFAFCDLAMILISKSLIKKVRNGVKLKELFTGRFPITKLIVVEIILFVVFFSFLI